uniref:Alkane hydroxylase MAH1-like n=1 Tax=Nelumbo nucifera TaxID=4432 RepID=A0A822Z9W2_NELNU|nr:TPA_asm: hypothetical protein HUJ06_015683 [Nelumbo nucifera]
MELVIFFIACVCSSYLIWYLKHRNQVLLQWPLFGSIPSVVLNMHKINDWIAGIFLSLGTGSFNIKGPKLSKLHYLVTTDPDNLKYILKTNFANFPKGPEFHQKFDILGGGIFNADFDSWAKQREMAHSCFRSSEFRSFLADTTKKVVEDRLVPLLDHVTRQGSSIDLQDVFSRFTFDTSVIAVFGRDLGHLSPDLPTNKFVQAVDDAQEAILYRFAVPTLVWKSMRWLKVGRERKYIESWKTLDIILAEYISQTKEELRKGVDRNTVLSTYIKSQEDSEQGRWQSGDHLSSVANNGDKFLRDSMLTFTLAGRDTTTAGLSWFFWLICKNPHVEEKILDELRLSFSKKATGRSSSGEKMWPWVFDKSDLKGLVYFHAAFCESLRLYPPLPLNSKGVVKEDVLPDGNVVRPGMEMILSQYAVGRMPWIWGEDCLEFKPERWIREDGTLDLQPMSKFFAFSAGPRSCIAKVLQSRGKQMTRSYVLDFENFSTFG